MRKSLKKTNYNGLTLIQTTERHTLYLAQPSKAPPYKGEKAIKPTTSQMQAVLKALDELKFNQHEIEWRLSLSADGHTLAWGQLKTDTTSVRNKLAAILLHLKKIVNKDQFPALAKFIAKNQRLDYAATITLREEFEKFNALPHVLKQGLDETAYRELRRAIHVLELDQKSNTYLMAEILFAYTLPDKNKPTTASKTTEDKSKLPTKVAQIKDSKNLILILPHIDELTEEDLAKVKPYFNYWSCLASYNDDFICKWFDLDLIQYLNLQLTNDVENLQKISKNQQKFFKQAEKLANSSRKRVHLPQQPIYSDPRALISSGEEKNSAALLLDFYQRHNIAYFSMETIAFMKDYCFLHKDIKQYLAQSAQHKLEAGYIIFVSIHLSRTLERALHLALHLQGEWRIESCSFETGQFRLTARLDLNSYQRIQGSLPIELENFLTYDTQAQNLVIQYRVKSLLDLESDQKTLIALSEKINRVLSPVMNEQSTPSPQPD